MDSGVLGGFGQGLMNFVQESDRQQQMGFQRQQMAIRQKRQEMLDAITAAREARMEQLMSKESHPGLTEKLDEEGNIVPGKYSYLKQSNAPDDARDDYYSAQAENMRAKTKSLQDQPSALVKGQYRQKIDPETGSLMFDENSKPILEPIPPKPVVQKQLDPSQQDYYKARAQALLNPPAKPAPNLPPSVDELNRAKAHGILNPQAKPLDDSQIDLNDARAEALLHPPVKPLPPSVDALNNAKAGQENAKTKGLLEPESVSPLDQSTIDYNKARTQKLLAPSATPAPKQLDPAQENYYNSQADLAKARAKKLGLVDPDTPEPTPTPIQKLKGLPANMMAKTDANGKVLLDEDGNPLIQPVPVKTAGKGGPDEAMEMAKMGYRQKLINGRPAKDKDGNNLYEPMPAKGAGGGTNPARFEANQTAANNSYDRHMKPIENGLYQADRALKLLRGISANDIKGSKNIAHDVSSAIGSLVTQGQAPTVHAQEQQSVDSAYGRVSNAWGFLTGKINGVLTDDQVDQLRKDIIVLKNAYNEQHKQAFLPWVQGLAPRLQGPLTKRYKAFREQMNLDAGPKGLLGPGSSGGAVGGITPVGKTKVGRGGIVYKKLNNGPDGDKANWGRAQ